MLKLNIGHSRKVGEANYGSRGASVNMEMEVESSLLDQPDQLRRRMQWLFSQARAAVDQELNASSAEHSEDQPKSADNGHATRGDGNGRPVRRATASQVRAIHAIANRNRNDLPAILSQQFHVSSPDELSISDASQLIDQLKSTNGTGASR